MLVHVLHLHSPGAGENPFFFPVENAMKLIHFKQKVGMTDSSFLSNVLHMVFYSNVAGEIVNSKFSMLHSKKNQMTSHKNLTNGN